MADAPLVSVGMPVRNGADTLAAALDSVLGQTHRNLEVIVSDNASQDDTAAIVRARAAQDPRVRLVQQTAPLSGWQNFRTVYEQARGDYFLWAAHDDLRDANYVETLLRGLRRAPRAVLAFSDLAVFSPPRPTGAEPALPYAFATESLGRGAALRRLYRRRQYYEMYGLFRADALRGYSWLEPGFGEDVLFLTWLLRRGDAVYEPGTRFYHASLRVRSRDEHIAQYAMQAPRPFLIERMIWQGAGLAAGDGARGAARRPLWFAQFYALWNARKALRLLGRGRA